MALVFLISDLDPPGCCSQGSEPKSGKNVPLRISYCSSAVERAEDHREEGKGNWEEGFQSEAETERKFMKFLIKKEHPQLKQDKSDALRASAVGKNRLS